MTPSYASRALLGGVFFTYMVATAVLVFIGPWQYPMTPDGRHQLLVFLVAAHAAFAGGYLLGIRGQPRQVRSFPLRGIVLLAVALQVLLLFPTSLHYTAHWIPNPWSAMSDVGVAYARTREIRLENTPYVNYVRMFLAPLLALAAPLAVFYWRRLGWTTRGLFVVGVVGTIALYVSMGTNAGAGNWMAVFPWFVLAGHLSGAQRLKLSGWTTAVAVEVCSLLIFAVMFSASMTSRKGTLVRTHGISSIHTRLRSESAPASDVRPQAPAAPRSAVATQATAGVNGLAGYLTQGYYAVYLSLQQPFVPTYGLGNSPFLLRQAARLFNDPELLERPYPKRIEKVGWKADVYWASIYPWIASDVGFPGTVVVMLLIGWMVGRVWLDVLGGRNPVAVAFLGQILLLLYYVPAHNRVMQSGEDVFGFLGLLTLWAITRRSLSPRKEALAVAFVGSLVPDSPEFHGPAFSRAGQRTQRQLVNGLRGAGTASLEVLSFEPLKAFPRQRRLFGRAGTLTRDAMVIRFIPFLNVKPFKVVTVSLAALARLVSWAWRHRGQRRLVCVYNLSMPPAIVVLAAAKATGTRAVALLFDFGRPGVIVPNTWSWWLDFVVNSHVVRWFDGYVVTTPAIARDLLPGRVAHVMDGGIEPEQLAAASDAARSRQASRFRMVLAGTLATHNGVQVVLDALALLPDDCELVVAGGGPLVPLVRERAERDTRVQYAGVLDVGTLANLYQSADLLLNLKLTQAVDTKYFFPSKFMELLGSGRPVLTTCAGHVADAYAEFVYLLRDETPAGLADAIRQIIAQGVEARERLAAHAREFVLREKTWDVQGRRLAAYLDRVAGPAPVP